MSLDMTMTNQLAKRLIAFRKKYLYSMDEFARIIDASPVTIWRIEHGCDTRYDIGKKIELFMDKIEEGTKSKPVFKFKGLYIGNQDILA